MMDRESNYSYFIRILKYNNIVINYGVDYLIFIQDVDKVHIHTY